MSNAACCLLRYAFVLNGISCVSRPPHSSSSPSSGLAAAGPGITLLSLSLSPSLPPDTESTSGNKGGTELVTDRCRRLRAAKRVASQLTSWPASPTQQHLFGLELLQQRVHLTPEGDCSGNVFPAKNIKLIQHDRRQKQCHDLRLSISDNRQHVNVANGL